MNQINMDYFSSQSIQPKPITLCIRPNRQVGPPGPAHPYPAHRDHCVRCRSQTITSRVFNFYCTFIYIIIITYFIYDILLFFSCGARCFNIIISRISKYGDDPTSAGEKGVIPASNFHILANKLPQETGAGRHGPLKRAGRENAQAIRVVQNCCKPGKNN
jgi:hypothetical protein